MSAAARLRHRIQHGTQHSNPRAIDNINIWRRPLLSLSNPPITTGFLHFWWGPFFQIFETYLWGQSWSVFCHVLIMILFLTCLDLFTVLMFLILLLQWIQDGNESSDSTIDAESNVGHFRFPSCQHVLDVIRSNRGIIHLSSRTHHSKWTPLLYLMITYGVLLAQASLKQLESACLLQ